MHAVNAAAFLATFAAYEYFLAPVLAYGAPRRATRCLAADGGGRSRTGFFICVAFTLTPIELTTPDLLAAAATFAALGALLRLRNHRAMAPRPSSSGVEPRTRRARQVVHDSVGGRLLRRSRGGAA